MPSDDSRRKRSRLVWIAQSWQLMNAVASLPVETVSWRSRVSDSTGGTSELRCCDSSDCYGLVHDHGPGCRDPNDPRVIANLACDDRSAHAANARLRKADDPSVQRPIDSGVRLVSSSHPPRHNPAPAQLHVFPHALAAEKFECTRTPVRKLIG